MNRLIILNRALSFVWLNVFSLLIYDAYMTVHHLHHVELYYLLISTLCGNTTVLCVLQKLVAIVIGSLFLVPRTERGRTKG